MSARANANDINMETLSPAVTNQPRRQHGMQKSFAAGNIRMHNARTRTGTATIFFLLYVRHPLARLT